MKPIHPICEEKCKEHYGKPVLVVLRDGSEFVGILSRFDQDKIYFNEEAAFTENAPTTTTNTVVKKTKKISVNSNKKKNGGRAVVSNTPQGFGSSPFHPFGGALALDVAFIALLFAFV